MVPVLIGPLHWFPSETFGLTLSAVSIVWYAVELRNALLDRRRRPARLALDGRSYWLIVALFYAVVGVTYAGRAVELAIVDGRAQYLGLCLMLLGIALRQWAILTLGSYWSLRTVIQVDHRLVTWGPFRTLRHPAYLGSALTLVGFPLAMGTLFGTVFSVLISVAAFSYRVGIEERLLLAAFGRQYGEYMRRSWRLFPRWALRPDPAGWKVELAFELGAWLNNEKPEQPRGQADAAGSSEIDSDANEQRPKRAGRSTRSSPWRPRLPR
jgi:protein-S-isoprenylcysteine O-methyltransferase